MDIDSLLALPQTFCCRSAGFYTFIFQSHLLNKLVVHGYRFIISIASSKSNICMHRSEVYKLSSQLPVTKYFPKCTLSFLACIFICVIIMYIFIPAFFKRKGPERARVWKSTDES